MKLLLGLTVVLFSFKSYANSIAMLDAGHIADAYLACLKPEINDLLNKYYGREFEGSHSDTSYSAAISGARHESRDDVMSLYGVGGFMEFLHLPDFAGHSFFSLCRIPSICLVHSSL